MKLIPPILCMKKLDSTISNNQSNNQMKYILDKYDIFQLKGPAFYLPSGKIICNDTWRASLEMRLDSMAENGINLKSFSLIDFLKEKIESDGTILQKLYSYKLSQNMFEFYYILHKFTSRCMKKNEY